jgi:hypothetical protein
MGAMSRIGALVICDPDRARREIIRAFRDSGANRQDTAAALGVGRNALTKYVATLGITEELNELEDTAKRNGWHHGRVGGRPVR